jgi:hypothetical protein
VGIPVEAITRLPGTNLPEDHNSAEDNPMSADYKLPEGVAGALEVAVDSEVAMDSEVDVDSEVTGDSEVVEEVFIIKGFMVVASMVADLTGIIAMDRE